MMHAFWEQGYALVEDMISREHLTMVSTAMDTQSRNGAMTEAQNWIVTNAEEQYSPVPAAMLLQHCLPRIEALIGKELLPGYAYWRTYYNGAQLRAHTDRASCEISATITIATEPSEGNWLFHVEDLQGKQVAVELPPGTGLIYQGHKVKHWREQFVGESHKQMFLHYVLKHGAFADHVFDQKGTSPVESHIL